MLFPNRFMVMMVMMIMVMMVVMMGMVVVGVIIVVMATLNKIPTVCQAFALNEPIVVLPSWMMG